MKNLGKYYSKLFNEFRDVNAHGYQVHILQKKALDKHDTHPETTSQRKLVEAISRSLEMLIH
jgi:hypothetical protein